MPMEHISLPVLDESGQAKTREQLETEPAPPDGHRLLQSPAYVDGIARGDVIRLDPDSPRGYALLERGGYLALVLALASDDAKSSARLALEPGVKALQGSCEGGPARVLVYSIHASASFPEVEQLYDAFCAANPGASWWFGNVYDPSSGAPLNWWK
ncbi:MAG TPA: DUF4265 domain-containing protein [Polyangiales bacterium]|nr:DUF4265 domain-containing protein [Polyangiales bacterium]